MSTPSSTAAIQRLYVAYFNRPADDGGLHFWQSVVEAAGGDLSAVTQAFSQSKEYTNLFAGKSTADIIDTMYLNLFGRHADAGGLAFWSKLYDAGVLGIADVVTTLVKDAQGSDAVTIEHKVTAASRFTEVLASSTTPNAYAGEAALVYAKQFLAQVSDASSLTNTLAKLGDAVRETVTLSSPRALDKQGAPSLPPAALPQDANPRLLSPDIAPENVPASKYLALLQCSVSWYGKFLQQADFGTPLVLTYSFMTQIPDYNNEFHYSRQPNLERVTGFQPFNEAEKIASRQIFEMVAKATGLSFQEVPDSLGGEIRLGMRDMHTNIGGTAYEPGVDDGISNDSPKSLDNLDQQGTYGDVYLNAKIMAQASMAPGSEGFYVLMHEIAHALGLKHAVVTPNGLTQAEDNQAYTVMSESYDPTAPLSNHFGAYDLAALQYLYGTDVREQAQNGNVARSFDGSAMHFAVASKAMARANTILGTDLIDHITGGNATDALYGRGGNDIIAGGNGNDTLDGGIGNDSLLGGNGNDRLQGSWGADRLDGGAGLDTLNGGDGSDLLQASGDGDTLIGSNWAPSGVADTVDYSAASAGLRVLLSTSYVENREGELHFDGTRGYAHVIGSGQVAGLASQDSLININGVIGSAFDDYLSDSSSFAFDEILNGGAGNDTLLSHGGGNYSYSSHDTLIGGSGDDNFVLSIYQLDNSKITLLEAANEGSDSIEITGGTASLTMPVHIENLRGGLLAKLDITGNAQNNRIVAGNEHDVLKGGAGNDYLDGGLGDDVLSGGDGDDVLLANGGSDILSGGAGADIFSRSFYATNEAQHIKILDFNAVQGDLISLGQGLSYTLGSATNGNALLSLNDGSTLELLGVPAAQFSDNWFG